jgi:hypothetical protein
MCCDIPEEDRLADILTNALSTQRFLTLRDKLDLYDSLAHLLSHSKGNVSLVFYFSFIVHYLSVFHVQFDSKPIINRDVRRNKTRN